ncbi:MAG: PKD domain-containing protein [Candidatus Ratteibacteria bacterium]
MVFKLIYGTCEEMKKLIFSVPLCFLWISNVVFGSVWLDGYQYRAEILVSEERDNVPVEHAAIVRIFCPAKDDGSDIKITDENGKQIEFFISKTGPGNFYEICFPVSGKKYYLFCGKKDAIIQQLNYRPKRGVLLELYRMRGDDVNTWDSCKKNIDNSVQEKYFVNAAFRKTIYDSSNPITQTGYFIRVYTGYFYLDKKEKISFGTTSTGASFIFVDEKLIASWPGRHWIEGFIRPEHSGDIEIDPGIHKLVYYHFEFPGWGYAIAAMKRSTDKQFVPIDEKFFLPLCEAKITGIEKNHSDICASFFWQNINYLYRDQWELVTFKFTDTSRGKNDIVSWHWDFGDGQTSDEQHPVHTYLLQKMYTVSLTITDRNGNSDTVSMNIKAEQDYSISALYPRSLNEYVNEFNSFTLSKLPDEELFALAGICNSYDNKEIEFQCYDELLNRNLETNQHIKVAFTAAEIAAQLKKYSDAERIYKHLIETKNIPEARVKLGFVYLAANDIDSAEQQFKIVIPDNAVDTKVKRSAIIGLGDVARYRADTKTALKLYESALSDTSIEKKSGIYSQQVLFYLKRKDFSTALEKLSVWADEIPTCKLKGDWSILTARAYLLKKDYENAFRELETYQKICDKPDNPYSGWATYLKGEIYFEKGEKEKARQNFHSIIENFPQSQISEMAKEKLKEMEK